LKIFFSVLILVSLAVAKDATIEVIKKVESLPTMSVEDASISYDDTFKLKFFKTIVADLNVISLFNVETRHNKTYYNNTDVVLENKDMDYVLRYKMFEDDSGALNVEMKLLHDSNIVLTKNYKTPRKKV